MTTDSFALTRSLGRRLRPLAAAIGIVISLGLPATYGALQWELRARDADRYASDLARALGATDLGHAVRDVQPRTDVERIRVLDRDGRVVQRYEAHEALSSQWWHVHPNIRGTAVITGTGGIQAVEVTLSLTDLAGVTAGLALFSTMVGTGLAFLVYLYPLNAVRDAESQRDDLVRRQETLLEANRVMAYPIDLQDVVERLASIARSLPGVDVVRIWLVEDTRDAIALHAQAGGRSVAARARGLLDRGEDLVRAVIDSGRPAVVPDIAGDDRVANREWFTTESIAAYLGVPLAIGERTIGALECMSRTARTWPGSEVALTETLGAVAAVAIRNARNFGELGRRSDRLRRVADLTRAVSGALDVDAVLHRVIDAVLAIRSDLFCTIRLVDDQAGGYRLAAAGPAGCPEFRPVLPFGEGLSHVVATSGQPLVVPDVTTDARFAGPVPLRLGARSYYGAPIEAGDTSYGVLSVYFPPGTVPSADEQEAIALFAGHAAIAIRNARIFAEREARRRAAEALAELGRVVAQALDPHIVAQRTAESASALLGAEHAALHRLDEASGELTPLAVSGTSTLASVQGAVLPRGTGVAGLAVALRQPTVSANALTDPRITLTPALERAMNETGCVAVLAVPLVVKDRVIGVLVASDRAGRVFGPEEIRLAQLFADHAALALDNARLYEEATRRRHEAEEIARVIARLAESLDVTEIAERVVASLPALLRSHSSFLALRERDGALRVAAWGGSARGHFAPGHTFHSSASVVGRSATSRTAVQSEDVLADETATFPDHARRSVIASGDRAMLAVPVVAKSELIGVLGITDAMSRRFSESEVRVLESLADQAALVLDNAHLYQQARRAYEELSETQAQLVRGETLRAVGELAAGAAHHLNNLLAVVLGRLELALGDHPSDAVERHIKVAERASLDSAAVVRRMRDFSRAHPAPDLAAVDLNAVVRDVVELTRPRWHDAAEMCGIHIDVRVEPGPIPTVKGEAVALREVLMNLLLNAIEALPRGGTITVRTEVSDDAVQCEVIDTGIGMTGEVQRRALEPFFTTKGPQSTGLGLAVNYGIIRRHGGELTIESELDRGTRVAFRLPVAASADGAAERRLRPYAARKMRVLLIDDDNAVREVIAAMLARQGHDVIQAASGPDGLARFDRDGHVDVVLTDLGMPAMTGWEVARLVKQRQPSMPVGLVTGWGTEPLPKPADGGAADFIVTKPVTADALRAVLDRAARIAR
jgi:GAF domain-containing protein/anti-sigma regulatory factor (Ser/Thr protein kinase)